MNRKDTQTIHNEMNRNEVTANPKELYANAKSPYGGFYLEKTNGAPRILSKPNI